VSDVPVEIIACM